MSINSILKKNNIRANVLTSWDHGNCKFMPNTLAVVRSRAQGLTDSQKAYRGMKGVVVAVSAVDGKSIRSDNRGHTSYFVMFKDGVVKGFDSSVLKVFDSSVLKVS